MKKNSVKPVYLASPMGCLRLTYNPTNLRVVHDAEQVENKPIDEISKVWTVEKIGKPEVCYYVFNNPLKYTDPSGERVDWYENADGSEITWYDNTEETIVNEDGETLKNVGANVEEVKEHLGIADGFKFSIENTAWMDLKSFPGQGVRGVKVPLYLRTDVGVSASLEIENGGFLGGDRIHGKTKISGINYLAQVLTHTSTPGIDILSGNFEFGIGTSLTGKGRHPRYTSNGSQPYLDSRIYNGSANYTDTFNESSLSLSLLQHKGVIKTYREVGKSIDFHIDGGIRYSIFGQYGVRNAAISGEKRTKL